MRPWRDWVEHVWYEEGGGMKPPAKKAKKKAVAKKGKREIGYG